MAKRLRLKNLCDVVVRINKVQQNLFPHGPFYVYIVNLNVIENNCQEIKSSDEAGPGEFR